VVNPAITTENDLQHDYSAWNSPFLLENESAYQQWKQLKLDRYDCLNPTAIIKIENHTKIGPATMADLAAQMRSFNFALFEIDGSGNAFSTQDFLAFGHQLGLYRIDSNLSAESDGVTLLSAVDSSDKRSRYIPYTNRALNWHTDGYYNSMDSRIDAFSLYCVKQAGQGGDNFLLDHEMVYMQIRDTDPGLLIALMDTGIMVVPANISNKKVLRQAESGPVFIVDSETGKLNMRYSARPQNIGWKTDELSTRAVNLVREILMDSEYVSMLKLDSGQGIVCNNVLHGRTGFVDDGNSDAARLYYRARYYDAVGFPTDLFELEN
jgi:hypothetical protein